MEDTENEIEKQSEIEKLRQTSSWIGTGIKWRLGGNLMEARKRRSSADCQENIKTGRQHANHIPTTLNVAVAGSLKALYLASTCSFE